MICPMQLLFNFGNKLIFIFIDNGLLRGRRQAVIGTSAEILLIGPIG